jgi:hypothetical protein
MRGEVTERTVDDIGDQALSYAEVKALATGNPLIMEKAGVESELTKLERLQAAHRQEQANLTRRAAAATRSAEEQEALALAYRSASAQAVDTSGDRFQMVVGEQPYVKRVEAASALQSSLVDVLRASQGPRRAVPVGSLAGFPVVAHVSRDSLGSTLTLSLDGVPRSTPAMTPSELRDSPPLGLLTRLENLAGDLGSRSVAAAERAEESRREAERASSRVVTGFEHAGRIVTLKARLVEINTELAPLDPAAAPGEKGGPRTEARRPVTKPAPSWGPSSLRPAVPTSPPFDPVQREGPPLGL